MIFPKIRYTNFRKLYPQTTQLVCIGWRWRVLTVDFRNNWVEDMKGERERSGK